ncbi:MAG: methenyltetrahydromethanopterin cyclohydrolase [Planctomycetes bacterium]|nr:methenyltetrahydromethanopterin cyclohydrolase [Planctomycetota bacterium]
MQVNARAWRLWEQMEERRGDLRIEARVCASGARILDCGVDAAGGFEAGRRAAEICLGGLAEVDIAPGPDGPWSGPVVAVRTDRPVEACLGAQYAGWRISSGAYFAMGSGPMRAAYGREALYDLESVPLRDASTHAVGFLEASSLPPPDVCASIAGKCGVTPDRLALLVARTASPVGSIQIAARAVETALHKLHELRFDVGRIRGAFGTAPIPPVAADDMAAIGRANDAVLYGGDVTLWVESDDPSLIDVGPRAPSLSSRDFGRPFLDVFRDYHYDFYRVDPLLFSPARITFCNLSTGAVHRFGETRTDILARSFLDGPASRARNIEAEPLGSGE